MPPKIKKDFYNCAAINVYGDRGIGCLQQGWDTTNRIHPICCTCPITFIAKNDRNEIKYLNAKDIHFAVAIVKGNGFETQASYKITGRYTLYKL